MTDSDDIIRPAQLLEDQEVLPEARSFPLDRRWPRFLKRTLDLVVGLPLLPFVLLALPVLMLIVKLSSPRPAIFRQTRVGRGGREITVLKFRTM